MIFTTVIAALTNSFYFFHLPLGVNGSQVPYPHSTLASSPKDIWRQNPDQICFRTFAATFHISARGVEHICTHLVIKTDHIYRVATEQGNQGKQGIWFLLFPDRENTGNFAVTQGKFLKHRENIFDCIYHCKKHVSLHIF